MSNFSFCRKVITVYIDRPYPYNEIRVKCGDTSPYGYPWECEDCERNNAHVNWRAEAEAAGENWDEEEFL
jgi:hypothetical protein